MIESECVPSSPRANDVRKRTQSSRSACVAAIYAMWALNAQRRLRYQLSNLAIDADAAKRALDIMEKEQHEQPTHPNSSG